MLELIKNPLWVEAIAKLAGAILWPSVAFVLALLFKGELSSIIRRIKKGKFFGNEFELDQDLDRLVIVAEKAQQEIYIPGEVNEAKNDVAEFAPEQVIGRFSDNPELGIIFIARKIESEMKRLLAVSGHLKGRKSISYPDMAEYLGKNAAVSENLRASLQLFWDVRNKVVHAHGQVSRDDLIRTIDIGLTILSAISAIPQERNVVAYPCVDLYRDSGCTQLTLGVKGVILETTSPGGATKSHRIFPTTKTHFRVGMAVSWEWNMDRILGPTYYKDPQSSELKKAWESSAEFVGRDLDSI
jgi:hypothetical protein